MRFVDKRRVKDTVNDVEPYSGDIVEVIEAIDPNNKGRVRFQGAGWTAISKEDQLAIGDKAKIVVRENTTLIVQKVNSGEIKELIFALSSTMEGDTTNFYIYKQIEQTPVVMTTIARGIAVGDELEFADEVTLGRSIVHRIPFEASFKQN